MPDNKHTISFTTIMQIVFGLYITILLLGLVYFAIQHYIN